MKRSALSRLSCPASSSMPGSFRASSRQAALLGFPHLTVLSARWRARGRCGQVVDDGRGGTVGPSPAPVLAPLPLVFLLSAGRESTTRLARTSGPEPSWPFFLLLVLDAGGVFYCCTGGSLSAKLFPITQKQFEALIGQRVFGSLLQHLERHGGNIGPSLGRLNDVPGMTNACCQDQRC